MRKTEHAQRGLHRAAMPVSAAIVVPQRRDDRAGRLYIDDIIAPRHLVTLSPYHLIILSESLNMPTITHRLPGLILTDHEFSIPLDHSRPDGEQISVFARA